MRWMKSLAGSALAACGLGVVTLAASFGAQADPGERGGGWLRSYAGPYDRQGQPRDAHGLVSDGAQRRPDADDARTQRRWSSEERRQLRNDIHEAGRDVYGSPARRRE